MKFSKKILETFVNLPDDYIDLMEDVGLEIKSTDGDIMNLELLANRGDHYCYEGIAREIIGRVGKDAFYTGATKDILILQERQTTDFIKTDKCFSYALTPFKQVRKRESRATDNDYIKTMLPASGVNLILDVIDITNVVMLEQGQPAHVYDADKIIGKIVVRETKAGESAALLFRDDLTELPAGTMVIADDEKILCVAGVIGCRAAEVDENTKNVLFETALFDPVSVRKTAKALGVSSIASQIFERGGSFLHGIIAAGRAAKLYTEIGWENSGDHMCEIKKFTPMVIKMSGDYVREQLEINITDAEIDERLDRYDFIKAGGGYLVPAWRMWDIKGEPADLIEELCRSIGYNSLPSKLPHVIMGAKPTASEIRKREIDSYLVHNGFYEVLTDSMYSPKHAKLFSFDEHVGLENSVDGGYAFMRNNTIVQATELVAKNLNVKNREIRAYEWGKVFRADGEHNVLWGVINGIQTSALDIKGVIENMGFETSPADLSGLKIHPNRGMKFEFGFFGEIHPVLLSEFDIKNDAPVYFEIDSDAMLNAQQKKTKYIAPSDKISSVRDMAISVPYGKHAGDVSDYILKNYKYISGVKITDVFDRPKEFMRNITYTLTFIGEHSADDLNKLLLEIMNRAIEFIS